MNALEIILIILGIVIFLLGLIVVRMIILFDYQQRFKKPPVFKPELLKNKILLRDQYLLETNYHFYDQNDFVVVFVHGLSVHFHELSWIENYFQTLKYSYLIYSRRNSGKNVETERNKFKLGIEIDDCLDIIQLLEAKLPGRKIIMVGHSLGAAILSGLANTNKIKQKNVELVIINPPSDLQFLNPFNFIEKNPKSLYLVFKGMFLNKNAYVRPIPKFLPMLVHCNDLCNNEKTAKLNEHFNTEYKFKPEHKQYLIKNYYFLRHWPFYFYANCFWLFSRTFHNISKNRVNRIWICQAEFDYFANLDKVAAEERKLRDHKNVNFLNIENFDHRFDPLKPKENEKIFDQIFEKVLSEPDFQIRGKTMIINEPLSDKVLNSSLK